MRVIDFHVHLARYDQARPSIEEWTKGFVGEDLEGFARRYSDPQEFLSLMDRSGIDYAVVLAEQSPLCTGFADNDRVAEFCRGQNRLIPFASLNPFLTPSPARELERLVTEQGFCGLKLYPTYQYFYPNDPIMYPVYAQAQSLGIPVMFHTGSSIFRGARLKYGDPLYLDDVAVDFPDLKILAVHGGRGFWYDRAMFLARIHPNLYVEISGLPPRKLLDLFPEMERFAHKFIFGSDWPGMPDLAGNVEAIRRLPVSPEAIEKILWGNAAELLGVENA